MPLTSNELTNLVASLTLEEKVRLLTGEDAWSAYALPSIGLRKLVVSDGPTGVRGAEWDERDPSLSLPSATCLASTWDRTALRTIGQLSAMEGRRKGIDVVLGPTINLHRSPRGGRHFEAYSEDPYLTGELAVAYIRGVQEQGVGACPKHYVANDSENDRFSMNSVVDEQTLRELYLAPFEAAVTQGEAWSIMSAYNRTNGTTMTENDLLRHPLKDEWGFSGVVVSDWTAVRSVEASANAAQDWAMPGPRSPWSEGLLEAVQAGRVPVAAIDDKVLRMLRLANRVGALQSQPQDVRTVADARARIRAIAAEGMVLVQNEGVLPLASRTKSIAVIGAHALEGRIMGGGSATVLPFAPVSPLNGLRAGAALGTTVQFAVGSHLSDDLEPFPIELLIAPNGSKGVELTFFAEDGSEVLSEIRAGSHFINMNPTIAGPTAWTRVRTRFTAAEAGVHRFGTATLGGAKIIVNGETRFEGAATFEGDPAAAFMNPPQSFVEQDMQPGESIDLEFHAASGMGIPGLSVVSTRIGYRAPRLSDAAELERAVALASTAEVAIVVVGTTEIVESEGYDRSDLRLPGDQDALVAAVAAVNKRTIVVVNAGSPVEMPWRGDVAAILLTWFPGEEMGNALADVIYGVIEPGGHLPTSWAVDLASAPVSNTDPAPGTLEVVYEEGLNIGYRAYTLAGREPAYWMGHGLGYTTWTRDSVDVVSQMHAGNPVTVHVGITNTGKRDGSTVVQVYLRRRESGVRRPAHWLAGFARVSAPAGASVTAEVTIEARRFQHWADGWQTEPGQFEVIVADNASLTDGTVRTIEIK